MGPHATNTRPQNQPKKLILFGSPPDRFGVDFGSNLASEGGSKIFRFFIFFLSLGAFLGPCWAQDRPRAPKTPNLEPKESPRPPTWSQNDPQDLPTWSSNGPQDFQLGDKMAHKTPNLAEKVIPATLRYLKGCSQHPKARGLSL